MHSPLWKIMTLAIVVVALLHPLAVPQAMGAPLPPTPCSDLVVTGFTITPAQPVQGLPARIAITVHNQGNCSAVPFVVQWKSDRFAPTGPTFQVPGLAANAATTINLTFAFPRAGNFLTLVILDTTNAVNETNEANNLAILSVTVQPPRPDLTITKFTINPDRPVRGRVARARITVENQGNSPANNFLVQWRPTLQTPALSEQVNELGPGASTTLTFDYTYPNIGVFQTAAAVDPTNRVFESDETNNRIQQAVIVEPPLPDLVIDDFTISPSSPVRGSVSTVKIKVKNQGNSPAGTFLLRWKPTPLDPALSTQINGLEADDSVNVTFDYTFRINGTFESEATVDSTDRVLELNEFNNSKRISISVQPATIDLTITSLTLDPPAPKQGQRATAHVRIANQGNSPATNFMVELNPGAFFLETPGASSISQQVDRLDGGAEQDVQFQFTYIESGNFRAVAKVDAFNNIIETNEANNLALLNVTVGSDVDLIITGIRLSSDPGNVSRGSQVQATITVKNQGSFPAGAFFVQWKPNQEANFGPVAQVDGLNPGQSKEVVLESVYFTTGTFTSSATADIFDRIVESNETNNTFTRQVTVEPRRTRVQVTFNNVHVINALEDGINGEGEWQLLYAILDREETCSATLAPGVIDDISINQKGIECVRKDENDLGTDDGEHMDFNPGVSFQVTLVESAPLVVVAGGFQDGTIVEPPDFVGVVLQSHKTADLQETQTFTVPGQKCQESEGHCFDLTYEVRVLSAPPALSTSAAAEPTPLIRLPDALSALIPSDAQLPPGVERLYNLYLPAVGVQ